MVSSRHGPGEMSPGLLGAPDRLPPLATAYIKTNLGKVAGTEVPVNPSVDSSRLLGGLHGAHSGQLKR